MLEFDVNGSFTTIVVRDCAVNDWAELFRTMGSKIFLKIVLPIQSVFIAFATETRQRVELDQKMRQRMICDLLGFVISILDDDAPSRLE